MSQISRKIFKYIFFSLVFCIITVFLILFLYWINWNKKSGDYLKQTELYFNSLVKFSNQFNKYKKDKEYSSYTLYPIRILDKDGNLIGRIKTNNKIIVSFDKIGKNFINALISTEDQDFYKHNGISFLGIGRAFFRNVSQMKLLEGGSTLTQQLCKLLFTKQERTFNRKMNEFFTALSIERSYTKNDILFMYSNLIYFGYNIYGIGLAARAYFGKDAQDLSIAEAALLVSLISNPNFYNPYKHVNNTKKKHLTVLIHMYEQGYLTKEDVIHIYKNFWNKPTLLPHISIPSEIFFSNKKLYILEEVRRFLAKSFGDNYLDSLQGSTVYTTIDSSIQTYMEDNVNSHINKIRKESDLPPEDNRFIESASIVSEVKTGKILSFLGGTEYSNQNQFNRAFQAKRQVGSTIKPFLYAVGLDLRKITPYTVFQDTPIEVQFQNNVTWDVNNYGKSYRGYLNISEALKRSSNVVAVQATNVIGLDNLRFFFENALNLSPNDAKKMFEDYQYSVALGAVDLTPYQLNQLYQILANNGVKEQLYFISQIDDIDGQVIYQNKSHSQILLSKESSYLVKKMLSSVMLPGGSGNYVYRNFSFESEIGGKSGTTQNSRDVWFSGITNKIALTTWVGQDFNKILGQKFVGGIQAGEIFGDYMQFIDNIYPAGNFYYQNGNRLSKSPVDLLTGFLPTPLTLFSFEGTFIKGTEPKKSVYLSLSEQLKMAKEKKILTPQKLKEIQEKGDKEDFNEYKEEPSEETDSSLSNIEE